jgi:acyl-CoA synthetase (AMP-forming)/AMP-acid ligase II
MDVWSEGTILDVLLRHAKAAPDALAFRFLGSGDGETARLTYGQLVQRARAIAALLAGKEAAGSRVLLLLDSGLPFIEALFGCMFAGVVPIPVDLPKPNRSMTRLQSVVERSGARAFVTLHKEIARVQRLAKDLTALGELRCHLLDEAQLDATFDGLRRKPDAESIAFIQFTSGSTSAPRGVTITHRNLISNQMHIRRAFEHDESTKFVGWLPMFHDMGLVGNVIQPSFLGVECTLMPPASFIQRPSRWLKAITTYRGTTSGAPNFAFDHCTNRVAEEEIEALDLSSWRVAFNGAEPVRARTIRSFARKFQCCGFSVTSFLPCYGLAEATLFVSGTSRYRRAEPTVLRCARSRLDQGFLEPDDAPTDVVELVSSGRPAIGQTVEIADPQSGQPSAAGRIGEIRIAGPNVAADYLEKLSTGDVPFLNTGDLGALWNGELFVVGRTKNIIIVRGRNIYAEDLEELVSHCHDLFQPNRCAAFAVATASGDGPGTEKIVIVQELARRPRHADEAQTALICARTAVLDFADVAPHDVVLVRRGTIPTTSSGKIRHGDARDAYLLGRTGGVVATLAQRP